LKEPLPYLSIFLLGLFAACSAAEPFSFENVVTRARELARTDFIPLEKEDALPSQLTELTYDQYRAIRNRESGRIWQNGGSRFRLELLHPGYLFQRPVTINEVTRFGEVVNIPFERAKFDFSKLVLEEEPEWELVKGYAGFRIQNPLNGSPEQWDEIASFVGASYFRILGQDQRYGISGRGLALNVLHPDEKEEFPDFVEYWLVRPEPRDRSFQFYALLDSPSVTGAYDFTVTPGVNTQLDVKASLFFRREVASVGLAPLTSMFFYGENSRERHFSDWRPEVHDSDGLVVADGNHEIIWRPLVNGPQLRYSQFEVENPQGFGLFQRDREFSSYEDFSNPYHRTPSYWVETRGKWGRGSVRLVELPTKYETYDNIVSFFEPHEPPQVGIQNPLEIEYALNAMMYFEENVSRERVTATRLGVDLIFPDTRRFVIDFEGPQLQALGEAAPVFAEVTSSDNGYVTETLCFKNPETGGWRVSFKLDTNDGQQKPVELRCFLKNSETEDTLTETWSYQWNP
jgi:glucans biosynthesis protein